MTVLSSRPDEQEARAAHSALARVRRYLQEHPEELTTVPVLVEDSREELVLPRSAVELLAGMLAHRAAGRGASVVPSPTPN